MKYFFQRHKIVFFAVIGVFCIGMVAGFIISRTIRSSMAERSFTTVAEAKEETATQEPNEAPTEKAPEARPAPTSTPAPSASDISHVARDVEMRRRYVIPVRTNTCPEDNKMLWEQSRPSADEEDLARQAAKEYTEMLFGKSYEELTGYRLDEADVILYTDQEGDRDAFLRVTDPASAYLVTVREADRKLLCADLLTYPETVTIDREKDALRLAEKLGYHATVLYRGGSGATWLNEISYMLTTETDECLAFSYCGNQLWQAAVYPSQDAMLECEYFLADIQYDYSNPAYPRNFVEAEAPAFGADQMVSDRTITSHLYRMYNQLSGEETKKQEDFKAAFYRDESGAREDCWVITGEDFEMTVSAYSRDVIRLDCSIPCRDLLTVPYDDMGGMEYEAVARLIGEELFTQLGIYDESGDAHGKTVKSVHMNAVYDGNYCTMDVYLEDGTVYELGFAGGVLKYAEHYANDQFFWVGINTGWVADTVYVNAATGKQFVPDYRDWDGDLHIKARPEN